MHKISQMIKGASKTLYKRFYPNRGHYFSGDFWFNHRRIIQLLLPWGVDNVKKLADRNIALGLVDAIHLELERLGFSVVEHGTKRLDGLYNPQVLQQMFQMVTLDL